MSNSYLNKIVRKKWPFCRYGCPARVFREAAEMQRIRLFSWPICFTMPYKSPVRFVPFLLLLATMLLQTSCLSHVTKKKQVYFNDFEDQNLKNILLFDFNGAVHENKFFQFNNSTVLGNFNNNAVELTVPDLPEHDYLRFEFDLYTHDQWVGDNAAAGHPSLWAMQVDGAQIITTTFSNTPGMVQSYPYFLDAHQPQPARGDAADTRLPGRCSWKNMPNGTTRYHIDQILVHSASQVVLHLNDALTPFMDNCTNSWSIDNLVITALKN